MRIVALDLRTAPAQHRDLVDILDSQIDPESPIKSLYWERMVELVHELSADKSDRVVFATLIRRELSLIHGEVCVHVRLDSFDCAPLVNGAPNYHFRLEFRSPDGRLERETRRQDALEAAEIILAELQFRDR